MPRCAASASQAANRRPSLGVPWWKSTGRPCGSPPSWIAIVRPPAPLTVRWLTGAQTTLEAMAEALARVGEIDICYETFGAPSNPAMLLIMGLGTQMVAWHDEFCEQLAGRGYFVIRQDRKSTRLNSSHMS